MPAEDDSDNILIATEGSSRSEGMKFPWMGLDRELLRHCERRLREELSLSIQLYLMADKFQVAALKLLARDRFYRAAEVSWDWLACFPDIIDEIYCIPRERDTRRLREIVCRLVGSHIRDKAQRDRMAGVMPKHGDFALGVLNYIGESEDAVWR